MTNNLMTNEQTKQGAAALLTGQEQNSNPVGYTSAAMQGNHDYERAFADSRHRRTQTQNLGRSSNPVFKRYLGRRFPQSWRDRPTHPRMRTPPMRKAPVESAAFLLTATQAKEAWVGHPAGLAQIVW